MMYGFVEGADSIKANNFDKDALRFIKDIRAACGNNNLLCIFGKYELNNERIPKNEIYRKYEKTIIKKINSLDKTQHIFLCPFGEIPKECYKENHHYTQEGFKLWFNDAVKIIQKGKK